MATTRWLGRQDKIAQVTTIQVTAYDAATTYLIHVPDTNGPSITTIAAGTVNDTATNLATAWNASTHGAFNDITASSATDTVTLTADTAGIPFTVTSAVSGGTGTIGAASTTTANSSPNDANDAVNWSEGSVPGASDDVYFDSGEESCKWNLDGWSGTKTTLNFHGTFTQDVGLPKSNTDGTEYTEYRADYLACDATTVNVHLVDGTGSGRLKLDSGSVQTAVNVYGTGSAAESDLAPFIWKGTHASNAMVVHDGEVDIAIFGGESATLTTLVVNGGTVRMGAGMTMATITQSAGTIETNAAVTTKTQRGGSHIHRAGNITTLTIEVDGTFELKAAAALTITTLDLAGTLDLTNCTGAITITNATLRPGCAIIDPNARITHSNAASCPGGLTSIDYQRDGSVSIQFS